MSWKTWSGEPPKTPAVGNHQLHAAEVSSELRRAVPQSPAS